MKIRVITDKYEYMGLSQGSIHQVGCTYKSGDQKRYQFKHLGREWELLDSECGEIKQEEYGDDFPTPNEKLLDVINTDLKQDSVLDIQHGGSHYKDKKIQPIEYITANNLDFCQGNVVKYVTRHKDKNGAEDIRKVIHYAQFILKFEYGEEI